MVLAMGASWVFRGGRTEKRIFRVGGYLASADGLTGDFSDFFTSTRENLTTETEIRAFFVTAKLWWHRLRDACIFMRIDDDAHHT